MITCDFLIIGAGIAGSSAGYHFADLGKTIILEREDVPGYHSTGRSAAIFRETHGSKTICALSRASFDFFNAPPSDLTDVPILSDRGILFTGGDDEDRAIEEIEHIVGQGGTVERCGADKAQELVPFLKPEFAQNNLYEPSAKEIDVAALHQIWLRGFKKKGGELITKAEVFDVQFGDGVWRVKAGGERYQAKTLINAAGGWADELAKLAGVKPVGLVPKRRTIITVDLPAEYHGHLYPMVISLDDSFYFKTEHGTALASPMDETPISPCDVQPEDIDIATAAYLFEQRTGIPVQNIKNRWAGLRVFTPKGEPVVCRAPDNENFIWLAGQGGYGIKTCDAMARSAVSMFERNDLPEDVKAQGLCASDVSI